MSDSLSVPDINRDTRRSLQGVRQRLWEADPSCAYCGCYMPLRRATLDHLVPLSQGGTNDPHNIVLACRRCNMHKDSLTPVAWREELLRVARVLGRIVEGAR